MSGFDTSQPIADAQSLKDVETAEKTSQKQSATDDDAAGGIDPAALGDATPGPR